MRMFRFPSAITFAALLAIVAGSNALAQPIFPLGNVAGSAPPFPAVVPGDYPTGRLGLTSGNPLATGVSVATAGTVFYTPYTGNQMPLWDGTKFSLYPYPQLQNVLAQSGSGIGPSAAAAASCYDMYVFFNPIPQQLMLYRTAAWTNCTTRQAGLALQIVNGITVNATDLSAAGAGGPAPGFGIYVGSIATDGASATVSWILPTAASGFGPANGAVFNIWNEYNRIPLAFSGTDNGASYTYSSNVIRQVRASGAAQVTFLKGHSDGIDPAVTYMFNTTTAAASGALTLKGFGIDSTTIFNGVTAKCASNAAVAFQCGMPAEFVEFTGPLALGKHFIALLEQGDNVNANTQDVNSTDGYVFQYAM